MAGAKHKAGTPDPVYLVNSANITYDAINEESMSAALHKGTVPDPIYLMNPGDIVFTAPHNAMTELLVDDHKQYPLLLGRSDGQVLYGGTGAGDDLTLTSTSNVTKGSIFFGALGALGEVDPNGQFILPTLGSTGGLLIGGDVALYRSAADTLFSPDYAVFQNAVDSTTAFQVLDADGGVSVFDVDTANERVGIGTDAPTGPLTVYTGSNDSIHLRRTNWNSTDHFRWELLGGAGAERMQMTWYDGSRTELMSFASSGGVGINTNGPAANLHVVSNSAALNTFRVQGAASQTEDRVRIVDSSASTNFGIRASNTINPLVFMTDLETLTTGVSDGYTSGIELHPQYDAAFTVTRHNYLNILNATLTTSAAITDGALVRFDAAAGTHIAVDSGTTKTTPGSVDAWVKINVNGTIYYVPAYTSKTA